MAPLRQVFTATSTRRLLHRTAFYSRSTTSETQSEHQPDDTGKPGPKPKISNLSVPGVDTASHLSEEQKEEVRRHNQEFEKRNYGGSTKSSDGKAGSGA